MGGGCPNLTSRLCDVRLVLSLSKGLGIFDRGNSEGS